MLAQPFQKIITVHLKHSMLHSYVCTVLYFEAFLGCRDGYKASVQMSLLKRKVQNMAILKKLDTCQFQNKLFEEL